MKIIRVLGIIPARGGSKSIPRKNIALLAGKPLIWYTIEAARQAKMIDAFIVSTDDEEIAEIARSHGADVPFIRPSRYAQDRSPDIHFMKHAIEWVNKNRGWKPEVLVNLRPTSPLRTPDDIDEAIITALESGATLVKTVTPVHAHNPFKTWWFHRKNKSHMKPIVYNDFYEHFGTDVPRQKLPKAFWQNGLVDVIKVSAIKKGQWALFKKVCGVVTDPKQSVDLDTIEDLKRAEKVMEEIDYWAKKLKKNNARKI